MKRKLKTLILVIIPLVFITIGFSFDRTRYSTDPESAYLLNGININMLRAVGHFDNPGTPVQIYSAIILRCTHILRFTGTDLETDVLLHSEYYIEVLRHSLIVMNAVVLFFLAFVAFSLFGNIWLALLLQISPFLSVTLIEELFTKVAPEPFLFATVAILTMLLFEYYASANRQNKKYLYAFALLSGFGLATKMTFLPLVIIPFIILDGLGRKFVYSLLVIPAFILFTLPAAKGYPYMAKWFLNLGTHTGTYGQGSTGFIDPAQYARALVQIITNNKELTTVFLVSALVLIAYIFLRKRLTAINPGKEPLILFSLFIAQAGSILMVAKHYHSNHYLFPALSLTGPVVVFIYLFLNSHLKEKGKKLLRTGLPFIVSLVLVAALLHKSDITLAYNGYRMSNQDTDETMSRIESNYNGYVKTYYYPTSFNEYSSLRWGNIYSRQIHTDRLVQLFPEGLFYNAWDKSFQLWETSISPAEFLKKYGGKILLIGGPKTAEEIKMVEEAGLKLNKLSEGRLQVIYEVDTAGSSFFKATTHVTPPSWKTESGFETFSDNKQWVMAGDEKFCENTALTTEKPRTGKYSFSLPGMDIFALNYELRNIKPGKLYGISIWRFGGDEESALVVSAQNSDNFYIKSKGVTEKDALGWSKIVLNFKIPDGFADDRLKVYLWNHSNKPVWFDDIEIAQY